MSENKGTQPIERGDREKELMEQRRNIIREINQFLEAEQERRIADDEYDDTEDYTKPYVEEEKQLDEFNEYRETTD